MLGYAYKILPIKSLQVQFLIVFKQLNVLYYIEDNKVLTTLKSYYSKLL